MRPLWELLQQGWPAEEVDQLAKLLAAAEPYMESPTLPGGACVREHPQGGKATLSYGEPFEAALRKHMDATHDLVGPAPGCLHVDVVPLRIKKWNGAKATAVSGGLARDDIAGVEHSLQLCMDRAFWKPHPHWETARRSKRRLTEDEAAEAKKDNKGRYRTCVDDALAALARMGEVARRADE